jgi:DNA-directed RNA polymerase specialized sigma subunit
VSMEDFNRQLEILLHSETVKTSGKKKGWGWLPWWNDGDAAQVDEPAPNLPSWSARGEDGPESDVAEEAEVDTPFIAPTNFKFVERPLTWQNPYGTDEDESELTLRWQKSKDPQDLEALMARNRDFLEHRIRRHIKKRVPRPAVRGMVYNTFIDSAKKWDPERGGNLRTFFKSEERNLDKKIRPLAQFGKAERGRVSKMEKVRSAREAFEIEHDREPTKLELHEHTGITVKDLGLILTEDRADHLGSRRLDADSDVDTHSQSMYAVRRVRDYYNSRQQKIINHMFGLDNADFIPSTGALARKFGMSDSAVSNFKQRLQRRVQEELQTLGGHGN